MIIAREIRLILFVLVLIAISAKIYLGWSFAIAVICIIFPIAFIFRDPICKVPSSPLGIVSPIQGEIISIDKVTDKWLKRDAIRIRIKMSFWDAHILRSPIEGKIKNQWAANGEEQGVNKRYTYWIQTDEKDDVCYSIAIGKHTPFIKINLLSGERIGQGQKCGYMYFTGITDVLIPELSRVVITVGDKIESGSCILAQIIHDNNNKQPAPV